MVRSSSSHKKPEVLQLRLRLRSEVQREKARVRIQRLKEAQALLKTSSTNSRFPWHKLGIDLESQILSYLTVRDIYQMRLSGIQTFINLKQVMKNRIRKLKPQYKYYCECQTYFVGWGMPYYHINPAIKPVEFVEKGGFVKIFVNSTKDFHQLREYNHIRNLYIKVNREVVPEVENIDYEVAVDYALDCSSIAIQDNGLEYLPDCLGKLRRVCIIMADRCKNKNVMRNWREWPKGMPRKKYCSDAANIVMNIDP